MFHLSAFVAAAILATVVLVGRLDAGEPADGVQKFLVGGATIWAIADSMGDRDMGVFAGADPEVVRRYVPSGRAPSAIMVFVIQREGGIVMIDAGLGAEASRLPPGLTRAGIDPARIDLILITHMHADHIGGLLRDGGKAFPNAAVRIGRIERDFWLNDQAMAADPSRRTNFELARQVASVYSGAVGVFEFGDRLADGIEAVDAAGHTPGHTAFLLESGGEKIFFVGDIVHAAALQFPRPGLNARYDMIPGQAGPARLRLLERAAQDKLPIAGAHLPFPGIGDVAKGEGEGFVYRSWGE
ncbi:MAG: MBL fold metallo-hydrolase [Planctomycetota bacterium]|jgi:glyoxylase-like metal-dependent hydrolase (beta-lactamase superfamily II)|nr:MBL fold metallo-hydrolase [Planctomycetota bacterium]